MTRFSFTDESFLTVEQYRSGHEARMRDARALQERNLAARERITNPPPAPTPEPPYDMSIESKPRSERTRLERLLSARFALQKAHGVAINEEAELDLQIYALKVRRAALQEKSARQSEWLDTLNAKIAKARP